MEINGVPAHPLVVHAVVVFIPLTALVAVVSVVWPASRWWARWFAVAGVVVSLGALYGARLTGTQLLEDRPNLVAPGVGTAELVRDHQELADLLTWGLWVLAALILIVWAVLPARTALASGRGEYAGRGPRVVGLLSGGALVLAAVAVLVLVVLTGDKGAQAVWL